METKLLPPPRVLADLAWRQYGVVSVEQLLAIGFGRSAIKSQVRRGRLHRVYRGVYAVGHGRIGYRGRCMAAVLAAGDTAVLSYRAAGQLWGLRTGSWIEVSVVHGRGGPKGIRMHQTRRVPRSTVIDGIPVTGPGRTLVDLADVLTAERLEGAFADAERLQLLNISDVEPIPGRRGTANLLRVLAGLRPGETKSELERRFKRFLRDADL